MKLTDAEWKLMNVIWERHPASARDIMEALEGEVDWAYTTIKTMLSRLAEKGALKSRLRANTSLYEPILTRSQARYSSVRALLDSAFEGAFGPMMHFLVSSKELTEKERSELIRLLQEEEQQEKGGEER